MQHKRTVHNLISILLSGFVNEQNIRDYATNRAKYAKKGRGKNFCEAIKAMDEFIRDPEVEKEFRLSTTVFLIYFFPKHFILDFQVKW